MQTYVNSEHMKMCGRRRADIARQCMHILSVVVCNQSLEVHEIGPSRAHCASAPKNENKNPNRYWKSSEWYASCHRIVFSIWKHSTDRICVSLSALPPPTMCQRRLHVHVVQCLFILVVVPAVAAVINQQISFYQIVKWNKFVVIRRIDGRNAIGFIYTWQTKTNESNLFATQCTELSPAIGTPNADRPNTCAMIACAKKIWREKNENNRERGIHMRTATVIII